jgi:predicted acylesterase/phospholipase RssA
MALANVAWILAASGKRVLAIDWDLEAPGLQRYFYPFLVDKELICSDGVINFVNDFKLKAMTPPPKGTTLPPDWYVEYADIRRYAVALKWNFPGEGKLDFVTAGRQDETYSGLVNQFNWQDFYERLGGSQFLDAAAQSMRRYYDYILIDSRTGVSDTSGVCTIKLPDALVVCFTLNYQGINGAATVADYVASQRLKTSDPEASGSGAATASSGKSSDGRPAFNIFPVPMRLENAEKDKLEQRRYYARRVKFAKYPISLCRGTREDYWQKVFVEYKPYYAYEEILAAFGEKERVDNSLLTFMESLTAYLTDFEVQQLSPVPQPKRDEVMAQFAGEPVPIEGREEAGAAEDAFARLAPEQQTVARAVLLRLIRLARPDEVDGRNSRQLVSLSEFDSTAAQTVIQRLRDSQVLQINRAESSTDEKVQLARESLVQDWERLRAWIQEDRNFLYWRQEELRPVAEKWSRDHLEERLLRGVQLDAAKRWLNERNLNLNFSKPEREFIQASISAKEAREREERERLEREQAERERLERERQEREPGKKDSRKPIVNDSRPDGRAASERASQPLSAHVERAQSILRGKSALPPIEMLSLAKELMAEKAFTYARRILGRAALEPSINNDQSLKRQIHQRAAVCTYKDMDLPADTRLDRALDLLRVTDDLAATTDQETLGIAGAIHKRKWEIDGQQVQLERSLVYYLRGYAQGAENDQGYTGINAAFVYDLLAHQEEAAGKASIQLLNVEERRAEARRIRKDIIKKVAPLVDEPGTNWLTGKWWFYSTVAEAHFGLGATEPSHYEQAVHWLKRGQAEVGEIPEWEYETTVRQLATLGQLQSTPDMTDGILRHSPAFQALEKFLGDSTAAVTSAFTGKIGIGLSGGGFRASLYHIGVLAKLAELDVLRRVEVFSCVSGGSIIGAHYYLEVRKLLHEKEDREITREDYIEIVKRIQHDFLLGVQTNVRTRVAAEFFTNLRMIFTRGYSRTMRAGELYEREIFSRVRDGEGDRERWMNDLLIKPKGEPENFTPKNGNWQRTAKAPILILNAATLNTGHSWQFTSSWMGEPPAGIDSKIDGNDRYRRMYYWEAPENHRKVRLGYAVAASACVPGLFEPIAFKNLFPDRTVLLVDGGTCDNQGVGGLLEQDCNVVLISDGSGQMGSQNEPSHGLLGVPLRSIDIVQARVRAAQFQDLSARKRSSLLRGFMFVHLKGDLDVDPIDWVDCQDPFEASDDARPVSRRGPLTGYGIAKSIQEQLAAVRTDLDSFSDVEAYALMTSGYRITEQAFRQKCVDGFSEPTAPEPWTFLTLEVGMRYPGKSYKHVQKLLGVSGSKAFKIWMLSTPLKILAVVLALALAAFVIYAFIRWRHEPVVQTITLGAVGVAILTYLLTHIASMAVGKNAMKVIKLRSTLIRITIGLGMAVFGWLAARLHLHVFDKMFLKWGSLDNFKKQTPS